MSWALRLASSSFNPHDTPNALNWCSIPTQMSLSGGPQQQVTRRIQSRISLSPKPAPSHDTMLRSGKDRLTSAAKRAAWPALPCPISSLNPSTLGLDIYVLAFELGFGKTGSFPGLCSHQRLSPKVMIPSYRSRLSPRGSLRPLGWATITWFTPWCWSSVWRDMWCLLDNLFVFREETLLIVQKDELWKCSIIQY